MIKLSNFEENFKNEDTTEMKRKIFLHLYEVIYKKTDPNIDINNQLYFSNALHNNKEYFERWAIYNKQMVINNTLQKIMDVANSYGSDVKVSPFNRVKIGSVVQDLNKFREDLLKKEIDATGYDIETFSLDEIRSYLYNSLGIKHSSIVDMYENEISSIFGTFNIDFGKLIVQGINPFSVKDPNQPAYVNEKYIEDNNLMDDYIIKGIIYGREVLKKDPKKIK